MAPAPVAVRPVEATDVDAVARILARAFAADPFVRWLMPDDRRYERTGGGFAVWLRHLYLPKGHSLTTDGCTGVALWSPPGQWRLPVAVQLRLAPTLVRVFGPRLLPRVVSSFERVDRRHPEDLHWYLGVLGTDPDHQRRGVGTATMAPVLERCDREGTPAYLETGTVANVAFYRHHGFEVHDELDLPRGGPHVWTMWREPRR